MCRFSHIFTILHLYGIRFKCHVVNVRELVFCVYCEFCQMIYYEFFEDVPWVIFLMFVLRRSLATFRQHPYVLFRLHWGFFFFRHCICCDVPTAIQKVVAGGSDFHLLTLSPVTSLYRVAADLVFRKSKHQ